MILDSADSRHLALFRILVFALWGGLLLFVDSHLYPGIPTAALDPKGIGKIVPVPWLMQSSELVAAGKVLTLLGCAACVLGIRPWHLTAGVTVALIVLHDAAMKALGGWVNHAQMALLFAAFLLALFPAADSWSISSRRQDLRTPWQYRAPLFGTALLMTTAYSFISARRVFIGGLGVFTGGSIETWAVGRTMEYNATRFDFVQPLIEHEWLMMLLAGGMFVTTVFEVLSPVALTYPRFRGLWLAVIAAFHFSTLVFMNIFFWENLVLLLFLFTSLPDRVVARLSNQSASDAECTDRGELLSDVSP